MNTDRLANALDTASVLNNWLKSDDLDIEYYQDLIEFTGTCIINGVTYNFKFKEAKTNDDSR